MNSKILKRTISFMLCIAIATSSNPIVSYAAMERTAVLSDILNTEAGTAAANVKTINDVIAQYQFNSPTGHGFAAEQGNNLIDHIKGRNTRVVGDNNTRNGPDRILINRDDSVILIQDKYYNTANASIDSCFDSNGLFKYLDADGNAMQIEVPKDQYDDAVSRMAQKIREGKVPGVTDEREASKMVKKGNLTYEQAKNLAKAGTVESLAYDAIHGAVSAGCAFGIGTLLNYATCRFNGVEKQKALKIAAIEGIKSGSMAFATAVIAGQLSKTGLMNVFKPSSEALTRALGEEFSEVLLKAYGQRVIAEEGQSVALSATKQAARLLRTEVLVTVVTTVVFSVPDAIDVFAGKISKKQFVKNFAVTAVSVVAGTVGYGVGGAVANLIVPGVGTIPGGLVGSILFGTGGGLLADKIADYITLDDADEMYTILETQFVQYCEDYMVNDDEAQSIAEDFSKMLTDDMFKEMYQSDDREQYASDKLIPLFETVANNRPQIPLITEEELRLSLLEELEGVVFLH